MAERNSTLAERIEAWLSSLSESDVDYIQRLLTIMNQFAAQDRLSQFFREMTKRVDECGVLTPEQKDSFLRYAAQLEAEEAARGRSRRKEGRAHG